MDIKNIPMRPAKTFVDQINIKVRPELKTKYAYLKAQGVDVGDLTRAALEPVIEKAYAALTEAS